MSKHNINDTFAPMYNYIKTITGKDDKMAKDNNEIKTFNMRMPRDIWLFLKKTAAEQGVSMTEIIIRCVEKYKKKLESRLTDSDTDV